jgi:hypothetical protein
VFGTRLQTARSRTATNPAVADVVSRCVRSSVMSGFRWTFSTADWSDSVLRHADCWESRSIPSSRKIPVCTSFGRLEHSCRRRLRHAPPRFSERPSSNSSRPGYRATAARQPRRWRMLFGADAKLYVLCGDVGRAVSCRTFRPDGSDDRRASRRRASGDATGRKFS